MIKPFVAGRRGPLQLEVLRALIRQGFDLNVTAAMDLDVREGEACRRAITRAGANVVLDCSGAEDVAFGESANALEEMVVGTENLALAAAEVGAHTVFVSNARVFGEAPDGPRVESDPPTPTSPLGAATVDAERTVASLNMRHTIVRSSSLYGRYWPTPFDDLLARARALDHLVVQPYPICPPTYASHFVSVLIAVVRRPCYGIIHRAATGDCNELELARAVVMLTGIDTRIHAPGAGMAELPRQEYPVCLGSRRGQVPAVPHWRIGLRGWALERHAAE